ncbi:MAG TPA: hypothetical protein VD859_07550 [Nocardioides sp.]|nr:hypothetical protein [Nocardioides sp.]
MEYLPVQDVTEVSVHLRGREPVPGLALTWGDRLGVRWAFVTYEFDQRVRTEWLPLTALTPRPPEAARESSDLHAS